METVLLKKSILTLDGKNYPVNLTDWGFCRLTGDDQAEFSALIDSFLEYTTLVIEQNIYTITPIFEEINGIPFEVAVHITRPIGHKFPMDDDVMYWVGRMRDDPCVTTFNWMEPVS